MASTTAIRMGIMSACAGMLIFAISCCCAASDFFIAPNGRDTNPGTSAHPFATLERARDAVRDLTKTGLPDGGVIVWLRGGTYYFDKSFDLTGDDSGTEAAPIVYRACKGEKVRLTGGREISGFKPVTDPDVLARIDESARGNVLQADLKAQGVTDFGTFVSRGFGRALFTPAAIELFFNDKPMPLASWPNDGWETIAGAPDGQNGGKFSYTGDRPKRWAKADDILLHGYWFWPWAESHEKVKSVDTEARVIETLPPHGVYGYRNGGRWRALNLLEELDVPGEWYADSKTGILYFWPPDVSGTSSRNTNTNNTTNTGAKTRVTVSILDKPLVNMDNTSNVTLSGFVMECVRGDAVHITGGESNQIADCVLRNIGAFAVNIQGGKNNGVRGCDMYYIGDGCVGLQGGERKTLEPAGNYVIDCRMHDFSQWDRTVRPAVTIGGVGNRIAHCEMYDAPHSAIMLSGNDHIIEFNNIHNVCNETADAGAFYIGRDWTQRGNVVRYNYFHDLGGYTGPNPIDTNGVYLDDWTSGTRVFGNVFARSNRAILIGGGRDNTVENNIFIDCSPAIHIDARGLGWAKSYFDGSDNTLFNRFKDMNADQPPYSIRYPRLATLLKDEPAIPKGNVVVRNIRVGNGRWIDFLDQFDHGIVDIRDNFIEGDPGLVDVGKKSFHVGPDSPVWKLGFKTIPFEHIGPRDTTER